MTNKEAIRKLKKQKAEYLDKWVDYSGVAEVYDMAIEALLNYPTTDDDTISRQAAKRVILDHYRRLGLTDSAMMELSDEIENLPSAEPTHGEWVNEWKDIDGGRMYGACCSVCHTIGHSGYNYCPSCGAKMVGDTE